MDVVKTIAKGDSESRLQRNRQDFEWFAAKIIRMSLRKEEILNPVYFETHFAIHEVENAWPSEFAIITAYAQTGEIWSPSRNEAADRQLADELRRNAAWLTRLTGYSPTTGHSEPGWAVGLTFDTACDIGQRFLQDAIYYVRGDTLLVSYCDHRRSPVPVGPFRERVHPVCYLEAIAQNPG